MLATLGLALLAGVLSTLSPCVLPLLPIVLGAAASEHRLGPAALAAGLAISFTAIGLFVATIGFAAGLDTGFFRMVAAILLIGVGVVLLVPRLQEQFALAAALALTAFILLATGLILDTVNRRSNEILRLITDQVVRYKSE